MSWATWAANAIGSRPVYLYKIEKGAEVAFYTSRFADYSAAPATMPIDFFDPADFFSKIDFFTETFSKRPIAHSAIRDTSNARKKTVTVSLPRTDPFAQKFIGDLGLLPTRISIWQGFENDTVDKEFIRLFSGDVLMVKPTWAGIALVCEDDGTQNKSKGIADVIQRPCRHALYHGKCTLALADFQTTGAATAMTGNAVTVTEASAQPDGYYAGGIMSFGGELQLITAHTGSLLTVLGPVGGLESDIAESGTQSVLIARGCNRSMADCDEFGNSANFGGFKELTDSPFDGRSIT